MNLIQIQEHLKDLPAQVIQSYANGANPEVPPYMALAEMQRRQTMEQRASQQQQAQQGPMPTVKEQIEQSAGLAGLQAKQAQQAQAQQQAPQGGPIPGGIPQPQQQPQPSSPEQQGIGTPPQPQPQQPQRMAEGGMTTASQGIENLQPPEGMFEYAEGGILGYAGDEPQGSVVRDPEEEKKMKIMQILNGYKQEERPSAPASDPNADQPQRAARPADTSTRPLRNQPSDFLSDPSFMESTKRGMEVKNPDEQVAMIRAAQKAAGAKENYGEEQRKRYEEEDAQYKEALKNRGFNNFINVMSGIGRGGLGGAAPAYLQQTAAQEAADIAHKRRLNASRNELDKQEQDTALGIGSEGFKAYNTQRNESTAAASRLAAEQQHTLASQAAEVERNKNELARLEMSNTNAQALAAAREKFDVSENALNRSAQMQIANMPPAEVKKFEYYFKNIFSKDPANQKLVGNRATGYKRTDVPDDTLRAKAYLQMKKDDYAGIAGAADIKANANQKIAAMKAISQDINISRLESRLIRATDPAEIADITNDINVLSNRLTGGIGQGAPSAGGGSGRFPNQSSGVTSSDFPTK
jgi:hypothetical protein